MRRISTLVVALLLVGGCSTAATSPTTTATTSTAATTITTTTVVTSTTTTTAPEPTTTTTEPASPAIDASWQRALTAGEYLLELTAGPGGVFAAGQGGVWHSANGTEWQRVVAQPTTVSVVATGDGGTAAFGPCPEVNGEFCDHLSSWHSTDGVIWVEQWQAPIPDDGNAIHGLAAEPGRSGFIAVGQDGSGRAAVWTGLAQGPWTPSFQFPTINSSMQDIKRVSDGYLAVGRIESANGMTDSAAVWRHTDGALDDDGMQWDLVSTSVEVFGSTTDAPDRPVRWRANAVTDSTHGVFVVGGVTYGAGPLINHAAIWHSDDGGDSWLRIDDIERFEDNAWIQDVVETPSGLIAVGHLDGAIGIWRSVNGQSWEVVPDLDTIVGQGFALYDAVVHDGILYVAGRDAGQGVVWTKALSN